MAKTKRASLGKGLSALLSEPFEAEINVAEHQLIDVELNQITPNELQPRKSFNREELKTLAQSIADHGVLQPLILRPYKSGYEIIAGERRWRAAKLAKLEVVPAIVMNPEEQKLYEIALIENMQRVDLNAIEEGIAYRSLIEKFDMTQEDVAGVVGKSRSYITNTMRLLALSDETKSAIISNKISAGHAKMLVGLDPKRQEVLVDRVIDEQLSVRQLEKIVKTKQSNAFKDTDNQPDKLYLKPFAKALTDYLGTKVKFQQKSNSKNIIIDFYDEEDLERIIELIIDKSS